MKRETIAVSRGLRYWVPTPVYVNTRDLDTGEIGLVVAFPNPDRETWLLGTESVYVQLRMHRMGVAWFTAADEERSCLFYGIQYLPKKDPDGVYTQLVHPAVLELIARGEYPDFLHPDDIPKGA